MRVCRGFTHFLSPCAEFFSTGSSRSGLVFWCCLRPPTSLAQSGIVTDSCLAALSFSVFGGRLRRPFRGGAFLRTSASPRGGATTALPLHGIFCGDLDIFSSARIRLVALITLPLHGIFCGDLDIFSSARIRLVALTALPFHGIYGILSNISWGRMY